jgi:hypothetical protein
VLINYPSNGRHTPPVNMKNGGKSHTHGKNDKRMSVWWYDNADATVYNYEKRIAENGFNKIRRDAEGNEEKRAKPCGDGTDGNLLNYGFTRESKKSRAC